MTQVFTFPEGRSKKSSWLVGVLDPSIPLHKKSSVLLKNFEWIKNNLVATGYIVV